MDWSSCAYTNGSSNANTWVGTFRCIPLLFNNVVNTLFMFGGSVTLIIIIVSGIRMIIAAGDAKQMETARKSLTYAIVGLLLIFFSYFILSVIAHVTGATCLLTIGPFSPSSCNNQ